MIESLISLLILVVVVGIVAWLVLWVLAELPLPGPLGKVARVLVIVIALLIMLAKALPMLGVAV